MRQILPVVFAGLFLVSSPLFAQPIRPIDGFGNNPDHPAWGSAGTQLQRVTPINYANGINSLGGPDWPNPRLISNTLFAQDGLLNDPLNLSDYCWVFGQFIDHDITFVPDGNELIHILVPVGDPWFDPFGQGNAFIPMNRSLQAPGTGTGSNNPRQHLNNITAFIDGSAVYGSDLQRANWLRTFQGGKLKTSAGNLLPYNTLDGELDGELDPTAPHMDNAVGLVDVLFVAGDARANENPLLTSFHTLFVREHNRLCDSLAVAHPNWTDEQLYQHARRIVGGLIQAIVFEEWLPAMGVDLQPYQGYDPTVNPGIFNVFSAAAFRLGHTLLNSNIMRLDNDGNVLPEGNLQLAQAFFNPTVLEGIGIDPYFKGMGVQIQQDLDSKVIDDVRNFLFGPPGAGGLDLASINITRGRERGIPGLNEVRQAFGLPPFQNFFEITNKPVVASALQALYGDIEDIDAWVGMLAESHMSDALFGETIMKVMEAQFTALRDGDRFYYEIDPGLSAAEIAEIKATKLHDVLMRNTGISIMQDNVFAAMPHEMLCATQLTAANIAGGLQTEGDAGVSNVTMKIHSADGAVLYDETSSDAAGLYDFGDRSTCDGYLIEPYKNDLANNGVTTLDLVLLRNHILGVDPLDSPYQLIAADANRSQTVSTTDMVAIQKVILTIVDEFDNNTSWRFVPADYEFADPENPFADGFPETVQIPNLLAAQTINFIAIKIGDLNGTADPLQLGDEPSDRSDDQLLFAVEDRELEAGQSVEVVFQADRIAEMVGYQYTLNYDPGALTFAGLKPLALPDFGNENFHVMEDAGAITVSWLGETKELQAEDPLFVLSFESSVEGVSLSELLTLDSRYTPAQAYNRELEVLGAGLQFISSEGIVPGQFALYQNSPNPVRSSTVVGFYLPEAGTASLTIWDGSGKVVYEEEGQYAAGLNQVRLTKAQLAAGAGVLYYRLRSASGESTRKMVLVD